MNKCPNCGLYMTSHRKYIFGGARIVWTCLCGYSTERCDSGMTYSDRTETTGGMDKGIAFLDIVEICKDCKFSGSDGDICFIENREISEFEFLNRKPDWCPIHPIPERFLTGWWK